MANAWLRHAIGLDRMTDQGFLDRFRGEIVRVVEAYPDRTAWQTERDCIELHRRHSNHVALGLQAGIEAASAQMAAGELAATCLLRMYLDPADTAIQTPKPAPLRQGDDGAVWPLELTIDGSAGDPIVNVRHLTSFTGHKARLVLRLKQAYDAALAAQLPRDDYPPVPIDDLVEDLDLDEEHVRKLITRCRDDIEKAWALVCGGEPPGPLLILNRRRKGYLLDPTIRFVVPRRP